MMSNFSHKNKVLGILFHDVNSRLCLLNDSGVHNIVVEDDAGLAFVQDVMMTDMKIATWDGSGDEELWESGIFEDLLSDLKDEGEVHKIVEKETISGALMVRE